MTSILKKICENKEKILHRQEALKPKKELIKKIKNMPTTKGFKKKLDKNFKQKKISVIAEIKKASPSKGIISETFEPVEIAKNYDDGKATCISILTDEKYFLGKNDHLIKVRKKTNIPLLRKDFIISSYQIYESRVLGADCILLISSILSKKKILEFTKIARELQLDVLIETHSKEELITALKIENVLIGINNRNLKNMSVNLKNSIDLINLIPSEVNVICESGINSLQDIRKLINFNFKSFLIGEFLMKKKMPQYCLNDIYSLKTEI